MLNLIYPLSVASQRDYILFFVVVFVKNKIIHGFVVFIFFFEKKTHTQFQLWFHRTPFGPLLWGFYFNDLCFNLCSNEVLFYFRSFFNFSGFTFNNNKNLIAFCKLIDRDWLCALHCGFVHWPCDKKEKKRFFTTV